MNNNRVLIVEDSPTQAEQLRWSLEEAGYTIEVAPDAERAMEMFAADQFDLVVSDIVMPGASGYQLCEKIKASSHQAVPVVLLSALNDPMTIIRALECGADNFLTKPYEPKHLISRIRTALSNRALRKASKFKFGVEVMFLGKTFAITSDKEQILDLLMSTFEDIVRTNAELEESQKELETAKSALETYAKDLEQRVAEQTEQLRKRQRQLSSAQEIGRMGDWHFDAATEQARWSDQVYQIFGQDRATFKPSYERILGLFASEDRDRIDSSMRRSIEGKTRFQLETRITLQTGEEKICWITGNPEIDDAGDVIGMFGVAQDITERRLMEAQVVETGERYRELFESTPDGVLVMTNGRVSLANASALKIFGVDNLEALLGKRVFDFFDSDLHERAEELASSLSNHGSDGPTAQFSGRLTRPNGESVPVEVTCSSAASANAATAHFIVRDVSRRTAVEQQLFQAQKMEAVGQLTGGISHDFNNLLTIIIGNLDVVRERMAAQEDMEALDEALEAALRGADLNQRLLAFSRRQTLSPTPTSVNDLLRSTSKLLTRGLGEHISLELDLAVGLESALVDAAQLESAITNLAVNARDAMVDGGQLRIRTYKHRVTSQQESGMCPAAPGDYIVVEVSDTGIGMEPEIQRRACDPFFTTKGEGKGTGLGLSMVHGFVEQSGGTLQIKSRVGEGTTVGLFLPVATGQETPVKRETRIEPARGEGEVILVVEDNQKLCGVLTKQLRALGYRTLEAGYGGRALEILKSEERVDLLLTDLIMPGGIDGRQVADEATMLRPGLKVILTSGFPEALFERRPKTESELLLRKPYRRDELARMLRSALCDAAHSPPRKKSTNSLLEH